MRTTNMTNRGNETNKSNETHLTHKAHKAHILHIIAALFLCACTHQELCMDHFAHSPKSYVRVNATWEQEWQFDYSNNTAWSTYPAWKDSFGMEYDELRPAVPSGLRLYIYNDDATSNIANIDPEGGLVYMRPGEHSLLFYNNDTEYILFERMSSYASALATTRTRTRSTYRGNKYMTTRAEGETVNPPDMLYGNYRASYTARRTAEPDVMDITLHPLVFTYLIRFEFESGFQYVSLARGALAGMARAVYLNSGRTSAENATVLFDCNVESSCVQARVQTFGVPDFPNEHYATRAEDIYAVNLEVRLKNGKMLSFDFDVTEQIRHQPQGGVITVSGITIREEEGSAGGSGFNVEVNDWGEYHDIII